MGFSFEMEGLDSVDKLFTPIKSGQNVAVVAKAEHAAHVEYGTSRSSAQPFARPGTNIALSHFSELEAKAPDLKALVLLLANRMAEEWKKLAPVDTGELRDSIEVEK